MAAELESLYKAGRQLFRQGKHAEAIQAFEQALQADPDQAEVHDAIATAYFVIKQYDKAIEHFTRVTQLKPKDAKAYINLGAVYNHQEEFEKAADILKRAISRDGNAVEAYYNLGIAYRGTKQPAMAINSYKEALKLNPRMLDAMQNLGNTYLEMNNPKAAIEQYKKALEINPDFERQTRTRSRRESHQSSEGDRQSLRPPGDSARAQAGERRSASQKHDPRRTFSRSACDPSSGGRNQCRFSAITRTLARPSAG